MARATRLQQQILVPEQRAPAKKPALPKGAGAVMQQRTEALDSLDFFPTPPWGSRAFCEFVLPKLGISLEQQKRLVCLEPAAGEGHMAETFKEYFGEVRCSDVWDYGKGYRVGSYTGAGSDVLPDMTDVDLVVTNPPFNEALEFAERALREARLGVALLVRLGWIESDTRWKLFQKAMPTAICTYVERLPMHRGVWIPDGSTTTPYCWVVWLKPYVGADIRDEARAIWIPPGQQKLHHRQSDVEKFVKYEPMPLFDGLGAAVPVPSIEPALL
jgi:hypothetical protein